MSPISIPSQLDALVQLAKQGEAQPHVSIYTDGACSGNPGPGGWGAVVEYGEATSELSGSEPQTTNNRMEMMGAIAALKALPGFCSVELYTDSMYLRDGVNLWMPKWKVNGWKTADKKPVKNQDLWLELDAMLVKHKITWHWVKGHAGHPQNEMADGLARNAIIRQKMSLI